MSDQEDSCIATEKEVDRLLEHREAFERVEQLVEILVNLKHFQGREHYRVRSNGSGKVEKAKGVPQYAVFESAAFISAELSALRKQGEQEEKFGRGRCNRAALGGSRRKHRAGRAGLQRGR